MKKCQIFKNFLSIELCSKQICRIMKLTTLLIFVAGFNVVAENTYSQTARVNLDMQDATIKTVISAIEEQSEFFFLYSTKVVDVSKRVDIHMNNERIDNVLDQLLAK